MCPLWIVAIMSHDMGLQIVSFLGEIKIETGFLFGIMFTQVQANARWSDVQDANLVLPHCVEQGWHPHVVYQGQLMTTMMRW